MRHTPGGRDGEDVPLDGHVELGQVDTHLHHRRAKVLLKVAQINLPNQSIILTKNLKNPNENEKNLEKRIPPSINKKKINEGDRGREGKADWQRRRWLRSTMTSSSACVCCVSTSEFRHTPAFSLSKRQPIPFKKHFSISSITIYHSAHLPCRPYLS